MKIANLEPIVKEVLERHKSTRENDHELYIDVIYKVKPLISELSFSYVFEDYKALGLPPFESVSRCRRKLQKKYPELKASKEVEEARTEKIVEYIEYSRQKESATVAPVTQ